MEELTQTEGELPRRTVRAMRWFLLAYSVVSIWVALFWLYGATLSDDPFGRVVFACFAAYGFVCAGATLASWRAIRQGIVTATRWIRLSLIAALPWTALVGSSAVIACGVFASGLTLATHPLVWLLTALFAGIAGVILASLVVLVRLLFAADLETLLWSDLGDRLHVGMNWEHTESIDEEVVLASQDEPDEADADAEVASDVAVVVEPAP